MGHFTFRVVSLWEIYHAHVSALRLLGLTTFLIVTFWNTSAFSQIKPPSGKVGSSQTVIPGQTRNVTDDDQQRVSKKKKPLRPLSRDDHRQLRQSVGIADRLSAESRRAFNRGLMSLDHYADQVASAVTIQTTVAGMRESKSDLQRAYQMQVELWEDATRRLRTFGQPASKGWAADLKYAELLKTDSEIALARNRNLRDDRLRLPSLVERRNELAREHFELRSHDLKVGLATLPQLARAASKLELKHSPQENSTIENSNVSSAVIAYRDTLKNVVIDQTRVLFETGAGLGRPDRLALAHSELARIEAQITERSDSIPAASANLDKAEKYAREAFQTQLKYFQKGTASLADLSRVWTIRHAIHSQHNRIDETPYQKLATRLRSDLDRLNELADSTRDLRGRNAADVTYVRSLSTMVGLNALQSERQPGS